MQSEVVHSVSALRILRDGPPEKLSLTFWVQGDGIETRIRVAAHDLGRAAFGPLPVVEGELSCLSESHSFLNGPLRLHIQSLDGGASIGLCFYREFDTVLYLRLSPEGFLEALAGDSVDVLASHRLVGPEQDVDEGFAFAPR